jgi:hypothetical protein
MKSKFGLVFAGVIVAVMGIASPAFSQKTSNWSCYLNSSDVNSLLVPVGNVKIWWGHTETDATWACNNWLSTCGNNGGCTAYKIN